ncbi:MAG: hypothetical protein AMJ55_01245 [Gammaproteobacteria bacterium SG8_15]|nr:MAG: hypothetical protein AMJ55_01245 [Gammaproteobacteria bacterium SG8_15]
MEKSFDQRVAEAKAEVPAVTPKQARERKASDPNTLFIDPRDAADITSTGIIPGALNLRLNELNEKADEDLLQTLASRSRPIITSCGAGPMGALARSRPIITSCGAGPMGALAAHALKQRGFSNVSFIDGGTQGWLDAGFATAR